ncbi:uncharacterized protein K441DRAFT_214647 [Cenococcum geophilum 1.58]|uniref:uncharacterized protein n=1 Tax=Cenococcum geophilum 1.58 TaxID=794803 RepID=UPI00358F2101|nr:hypothetical protein K441DRAFT_214647 [Cenococcum geophilum 1.58]
MVRSANNDLQIIHEVKTPGPPSNPRESASPPTRTPGGPRETTSSALFFGSLCISLNQFRDIVFFGTYILFVMYAFNLCNMSHRWPARFLPSPATVLREAPTSIHFNYLSQVARKSKSSDKNPPPLYRIRSYSITSCNLSPGCHSNAHPRTL